MGVRSTGISTLGGSKAGYFTTPTSNETFAKFHYEFKGEREIKRMIECGNHTFSRMLRVSVDN